MVASASVTRHRYTDVSPHLYRLRPQQSRRARTLQPMCVAAGAAILLPMRIDQHAVSEPMLPVWRAFVVGLRVNGGDARLCGALDGNLSTCGKRVRDGRFGAHSR